MLYLQIYEMRKRFPVFENKFMKMARFPVKEYEKLEEEYA